MADCDLRSVLLHIDIEGEIAHSRAWGVSADGEAAAVGMTFRTGEMPVAQLATLALILVDEGTITLDDPIAAWLPDLPDADRVSVRKLANMTAGYRDYTQDPDFRDTWYADPTRQYSDEELLEIGLGLPRAFEPGDSWEFSHTNVVVLGQVIEAVTGQPLADVLQQRVLDPAAMSETVTGVGQDDPVPALHAFSAERRGYLDVPDGEEFIEESTGWTSSWALPEGARQVSTVADLARGAGTIGGGDLLTSSSRAALVQPARAGSGEGEVTCTCEQFDSRAAYGFGINLSGDWMVQSANVAGYGTVHGLAPGRGNRGRPGGDLWCGEFRRPRAVQVRERVRADPAPDRGNPRPAIDGLNWRRMGCGSVGRTFRAASWSRVAFRGERRGNGLPRDATPGSPRRRKAIIRRSADEVGVSDFAPERPSLPGVAVILPGQWCSGLRNGVIVALSRDTEPDSHQIPISPVVRIALRTATTTSPPSDTSMYGPFTITCKSSAAPGTNGLRSRPCCSSDQVNHGRPARPSVAPSQRWRDTLSDPCSTSTKYPPPVSPSSRKAKPPTAASTVRVPVSRKSSYESGSRDQIEFDSGWWSGSSR